MSDDSEDEGGGESREEMVYRRKYQMLLERCEVLQQDNERLVHRIQQVYKYTRQVRKEKKFLINRLDNYGDNWRQGITQYFYESNVQHTKPNRKLKHHSHSGEKHPKKSPNTGGKRVLKDKSDSDIPPRKQMKESSSKSSKNSQGYNYM
ncbi:hypothetical protein RUM44_010644 [Polyplax serrata]|uniref:INO80 complex subunit F domain-containing protein n=1 Tax=Polyplax serrata TaxID=468196 RepID=A0ABR1APJ5_POLSC